MKGFLLDTDQLLMFVQSDMIMSQFDEFVSSTRKSIVLINPVNSN